MIVWIERVAIFTILLKLVLMDDSTNNIPLSNGLPSVLSRSMPKIVEELAELVASANRDRSPIMVAGNSSKLDWGGIVTGAQSLANPLKNSID
jgi:glycolate oxidase FAD binding subunit